MTNKHSFEIGETYSNRQGEYEVVQLDDVNKKMVIRYLDSGEEIDTSITLQVRIWTNMSWEEQEAAQRREKDNTRYQQGYGEAFTGLTDIDFKTNTEGTSWRSRRGLAGRVSLLLSNDVRYTFVSWAIYRWPVAFLTHRENYKMAAFELGSRKIKFTIEIDEYRIYFGLYIERSDADMGSEWDWTRLLPKLKGSLELQDNIFEAERDLQFHFIGRSSNGSENYHFADGLDRGAYSLWDEHNKESLSVSERIQLLSSLPEGQWGEVYLIGSIEKVEAVNMGADLADTIAAYLHTVLPLYEAAIQD